MANEITLGTTLTVNKNGATANLQESKQITMTGNTFIVNVQNVGTTTEALVFGDVTVVDSIGFVKLKNLDAVNVVSFSTGSPAASGTGFCTLRPGETAVFPTRCGTINAIAYGAAVNVQV